MLGPLIKAVREKKGITQEELATRHFMSRRTLSNIEKSGENINFYTIAGIIKYLNDPVLTIEAINELTGGMFSIKTLNGSNVDLHRSCVKEKIIEELNEAINVISNSRIYQNPNGITGLDRSLIRKGIMEIIDVFNASGIYIQVMCSEYGFDAQEMFKEQEEKMIKKGYIKK